jgi:hypothetical protein
MLALKGFYDGKTVRAHQPIPIKQQGEVIITFLDTLPDDDFQERPVIHPPKYTGSITDDYFDDVTIDTSGFVFNRDEANER